MRRFLVVHGSFVGDTLQFVPERRDWLCRGHRTAGRHSSEPGPSLRVVHQLSNSLDSAVGTKVGFTMTGEAQCPFIVASSLDSQVMWLPAEPHPLWSLHGIPDTNTDTGLQRAPST